MIPKPPGTYRFFYHYYRSKDKMTFHFKKQCIIVDKVVCLVPTETKRNKIQPRLVEQGFCKNYKLEGETLFILE